MTESNKKFIDYYGLEVIFNYPVSCSLLFFGVYWAAPAMLQVLINVISNGQEESGRFIQSYINDLTHLFFAIIVSIGSFFAAKICGIINKNEDKLVCQNEYEDHAIRTIWRFSKISNGCAIKLLALAICVITATVVTNIALKEESWWGVNAESLNLSGVFFIINSSAMVFLGISVFIQISLRSILTSILAKKFIHIDFFHSDGCNGQKNVGNLIMHGWALSITCVSSIFILYYMGYLGIEDSIVAATISFILIFAIPMISILPLLAIVRSVNEEKIRAIYEINKKSMITEMLQNKPINKKAITHLGVDEYFAIRGYIEGANVWPFNLKAISLAVVAYMIQSILVFDQLHGVIKKWWLS